MDYFIGDIHGRTFWEQVKAVKKTTDHVFFVGDYFDSKDGIPFQQQLDNFYNICDWASDNIATVHLCYGNHDVQYLSIEKTGDYQTDNAIAIKTAYMSYMDLFKIYYVHNGYIISHAGICNEFLERTSLGFNSLNSVDLGHFKYTKDGDSPMWMRPEDWESKTPIAHYKQIVGHTPTLRPYTNKKGIEFIDTYGGGYVKHDTVKSMVMKRAWALMKKHDGFNKSTALKQAWAEYHAMAQKQAA